MLNDMTGNSKVSILIISYNEKEYLPQAVRSCLSQTYDNKEIIIGDDGSSDGSIEYIRNLEEAGIRHFIMQRDAGEIIPSIRVSNVIRRGLNEAKGEYFTILSGDDYYIYDQMLSEAVDFLDSHNDCVAYVGGFRQVDDAGTVINETIPVRTDSVIYWSGDYTHISCFVFRKLRSCELLDRMCDDTGLQYVLAGGKWGFGNTAVLAYRQRNASIQHMADPLELAILEAMVLQDIMNHPNKKLLPATFSKYYKPVKYITKHITELDDSKYGKYLRNCSMYDNDIISAARNGKVPLHVMWVCNRYYALRRKLS